MKATGSRNVSVLEIALFGAALMLSSSATGCVGDPKVYGNIPPTTFHFVTVIEHDMRGPGGWQVAQVAVLLGRLSAMFPERPSCDVEVQLPLVNRKQGYISVQFAQTQSAIAADKAACELLGKRKRPTASLCNTFETG